ncbi:MAG: hypothetical protein AB1Z98_06995 [Nannocystaceae bacterium]
MSSPAIRPRFEVFVDAPAERVLQQVEDRIEASDAVRGWVSAPYAELRMPARDRFLWSPRMALLAEDAPGGTNLVCRLQPEPDVWTAYVALWAVLGAAAIGVLMYGASRWVVSGSPGIIAIGLPIVAGLAVGLYLGALSGQRRGRTQMWLLRRELDAALAGLGPRLVDDALDDLPRAPGFGPPPRT